jgi:hypothetical protein
MINSGTIIGANACGDPVVHAGGRAPGDRALQGHDLLLVPTMIRTLVRFAMEAPAMNGSLANPVC